MRRVALALLVALLPTAAAGCGSTLASAPAGSEAADFVPGSNDLYVVVDGDLEGDGWARAEKALDRFPRLRAFAEEALGGLGGSREEWDAALGPEVALAVVNLEYREAVALTRPDDAAELRRLVEDAGGTVAELDRGWWAAAHDERALERLLSAREADGALSERDDYRTLAGDLPEDAFARLFVRGGPAGDALSDLPALPEPLGEALECVAAGRDVPSAAFALTPGEDGVRIDGALQGSDDWPGRGDGFWNIADIVPDRPLVFAGAASMPEGLDRALACAAGADEEALGLVRTLGLGATALLSGEVAVAVYPSARRSDRPTQPTVALYAEVADEDETRALLERAGELASAVVPGLRVEDLPVDPDASGPISVVELEGEPVLYVAVELGLIAVSNTRRGVEGVTTVHESPLAGSDRYRDAFEALHGGRPEVDAVVYVDADRLPARGPWAAEIEPLDSLLLTADAAGGTVTVRGLLGFD